MAQGKEVAIYLETDRMVLREMRLADENLIFDLDSDPDVMEHLSAGAPSTMEDVRGALLRTQDLYKKHNGRFGFWAAIQKSSGDFMGWFLFRPSKKDADNVKRIEVGYRIKKSFWGKGFATEGSRSLLKKGFLDLGVEEVFATTRKVNSASRRVMEKIGLKFRRDFMEHDFPGPDKSAVEYSITKSEWDRTR